MAFETSPTSDMTPSACDATPATGRAWRIGCVGYLNAKPLIEGLTRNSTPEQSIRVRLDVPSALLEDLNQRQVDIALCPVIDYFRSPEPLVVVPVGCIASDGPTQTVRLFSRDPIESLRHVHADTDSHTSVALLRVLFHAQFKRNVDLVPFNAITAATGQLRLPEHRAMLLIGDKVVTNAPPTEQYPYQMDLGEAWKKLTGLPFVFAVWMARQHVNLGNLPEQLARQLDDNLANVDQIAARHAVSHGWSPQSATDYLGKTLSYRFGDRERQAVERFSQMCADLGLIEPAGPLRMYAES
ncbi:MAG: menaquinone biosynthesis protein [Phycisphaeraceae bacterium]